MSKRKAEEKIRYYNEKIRKLQDDRKRWSRIIYTSSSSEDEDDQIGQNVDDSTLAHDPSVSGTQVNVENSAPDHPIDISGPEHNNGVPDSENRPDAPTVLPQPELGQDLLMALGESTDGDPEYGDRIHENLTKLWLPLLKKGMIKENKDKILKDYLVPDNCRLLQAPKLNVEISAAVPDMVRNRDKNLATMQQQLGSGISAINRAMDVLLKGVEIDKIQTIKHLSNGCRILCDLHATSTQNRIKLITPSLDKTFLQVIQDAERDETVFGNKLSEKIKAAKTIERQGLQIKKSAPKTMTASSQATSTRASYSGNWSAPPRYTSNRGGAGECSQADDGANTPDVPSVAIGQDSQHGQNTCSGTITQRLPSSARGAYPGCREAIQQSFNRRGTPQEAMKLMLASLSDSTIKQYDVTYKLWWQFCAMKNHDVFEPSKTTVLSFLSEQFNQCCAYGTLNSHRSALSLLLGNNVGSDDCVKRLLKGAYKRRPNAPKYNHTWDPQIVLNHISHWYPNRTLNLEKITKKLVTLLAICTAHRVQTLSLIKVENIIFSNDGIQIGITDVIKTSAVGREQPVLYLPFFRENVAICPATALGDYIFVTKNKRAGSIGNLLLTYKPPHKAATSQTISRWIKDVLSESGIDIAVFSAHSSRHAATSAASRAGVSVDTIRRTAGWTTASNTFARFYNRPISDEGLFARSVCLPNNGS